VRASPKRGRVSITYPRLTPNATNAALGDLPFGCAVLAHELDGAGRFPGVLRVEDIRIAPADEHTRTISTKSDEKLRLVVHGGERTEPP
jgi:hypothetical protein